MLKLKLVLYLTVYTSFIRILLFLELLLKGNIFLTVFCSRDIEKRAWLFPRVLNSNMPDKISNITPKNFGRGLDPPGPLWTMSKVLQFFSKRPSLTQQPLIGSFWNFKLKLRGQNHNTKRNWMKTTYNERRPKNTKSGISKQLLIRSFSNFKCKLMGPRLK